MTAFKIIQSSPPHTGSTVLVNLLHGYLIPDEPIHWNSEKLIDKFLVTKTHSTNIEKWERVYPHYKLLFIMSERNDGKVTRLIDTKYKRRSNVLVVNYDQLLETDNNSIQNIIDYMYDIFDTFLPKEISPHKDERSIKDDMMKRFNLVNETVERMKDKPFREYDKFTHIHGSHRNR